MIDKPDILVVDDNLANLRLITGMLADQKYRVRPVTSAQQALRAARLQAPDLFLLDINMPEVNGFELCRQLRSDPIFQDIPIIFLTALTEAEDKVAAFENGGDDYITKPFQFEEIEARIAFHLERRRLQAELEESNRRLAQQNRELLELRSLTEQLHRLIVHDLRNPLTGLSGFLELAELHIGNEQPEKAVEAVAKAARSAEGLGRLIDILRDIARLEHQEFPIQSQEVDLGELLGDVALDLGPACDPARLQVQACEERAWCDPALTRRVIANLLSNSLTASPPDSAVELNCTSDGTAIRVTIDDQGPVMPNEVRDRIFEKYAARELRRSGMDRPVDLSLAFCRVAVTAQGGDIGVADRPSGGHRFWFTIPASWEENA